MKKQAMKERIAELEAYTERQTARISNLQHRLRVAETPQPPVFVETTLPPLWTRLAMVLLIAGCAVLAIYFGVTAW